MGKRTDFWLNALRPWAAGVGLLVCECARWIGAETAFAVDIDGRHIFRRWLVVVPAALLFTGVAAARLSPSRTITAGLSAAAAGCILLGLPFGAEQLGRLAFGLTLFGSGCLCHALIALGHRLWAAAAIAFVLVTSPVLGHAIYEHHAIGSWAVAVGVALACFAPIAWQQDRDGPSAIGWTGFGNWFAMGSQAMLSLTQFIVVGWALRQVRDRWTPGPGPWSAALALAAVLGSLLAALLVLLMVKKGWRSPGLICATVAVLAVGAFVAIPAPQSPKIGWSLYEPLPAGRTISAINNEPVSSWQEVVQAVACAKVDCPRGSWSPVRCTCDPDLIAPSPSSSAEILITLDGQHRRIDVPTHAPRILGRRRIFLGPERTVAPELLVSLIGLFAGAWCAVFALALFRARSHEGRIYALLVTHVCTGCVAGFFAPTLLPGADRWRAFSIGLALVVAVLAWLQDRAARSAVRASSS